MTVIKLKNSNVSNKVPVVTDLVLGEICVNTFDGELYFKKNDGVETIITLASSNNLITINNNNLIGTGNIDVSLNTKSNSVTNTSFTGTPRKATVTFSTPFPNANYSVSIMGADSRAWSYESKTASGFVINSNANRALTGNVDYIAVKHGEV